MTNIYSMTLQENVFYAKRGLVDSVWKEALIAGIDITYPETKEIIERRTVSNISVDDTIAVNNLKLAWWFIFDNIHAPIDLAFLIEINKIVRVNTSPQVDGLRLYAKEDASLNKTEKRTGLAALETMIAEQLKIAPSQACALNMFCKLCKEQIFLEGNKRTAQIAANKILISSGAGILAIPPAAKTEFESLLSEYTETEQVESLLRFLATTSIDGHESVAGR